MATWKEIATKHMRAVPKGATMHERAQALKEASREYRGLSSRSIDRRARPRRNPSDNKRTWWLIGGAVALYLWSKQRIGIAAPNGK